jgi:hypothetical protein
MPLNVTHSTVVGVADDGTSPVGSDEWNAAHTISGVLPAANVAPAGSDGQVQYNNGGAVAGATGLIYDDTNNTFADPNGNIYSNIPQNSRSAAYTLVLLDAQKHIFHPSADTTARTWTIPANSSVAYPIGTTITFVNQNAAGVITIAITTDTMRLAGTGTTGNRTLAANGIATAMKVTATEWIISGTGLT